MKAGRQSEREARQLFRFCVVDGNFDEKRARLVTQRVLQSKPRGYLSLLEQFQRLLKFEVERHTAEIESAVPLPDDLRIRVQTRLANVYGPRVTSLFIHNPALIGGMRIKVGSDVYDGSVRSGLAALARSFGLEIANGRHTES
jgi:F-type H+-transporting ATPase subunit delta